MKKRIEKLVQKNQTVLNKNGFQSMSSTLGRASQYRTKDLKGEYEKEKNELNKILKEKNHEIEGFREELEIILKEMEYLHKKQLTHKNNK